MTIHLDVRDRVATVTIDRPHRRGALDLDTLESLHRSIETAVGDGARALVITGSQGHFCASRVVNETPSSSVRSAPAQK